MSTNKHIPNPTDYVTVLAALSLLSIEVHVSKYDDLGVVEVFTLAPNEDEPSGGFKFTFKGDKLIGLHARNSREACDQSWSVVDESRNRSAFLIRFAA